MVEFSAETKKFGNKELGVQFDGNVGGLKEKAELGGILESMESMENLIVMQKE